jgi:hypothetical protein
MPKPNITKKKKILRTLEVVILENVRNAKSEVLLHKMGFYRNSIGPMR